MGRVKEVLRLFAIAVAFAPLAVTVARDRRRWLLFGEPRDVDAEVRRRRAVRLRETFVELGPTLVKLGQVLSTRADALPKEYTEELSKLQDQVPPAGWSQVREVLVEDVDDPDEVFDGFDTEPVNSASIGQVYRAWLDGRELAVKVRRPGVEATVEADLSALHLVSPVVERFLDEADAYTFSRVLDQFEKVLLEEIDYSHEREAMQEVRENFGEDDSVRVPEVYHDLSGRRVTTMEWMEGVKVTEAEQVEGVDPADVVESLQHAYAEMVLDHGVFHADPHPGNVAVAEDGALVLYDFGAVGRLSEGTRENLFEFYDALREEDYDGMLASFVEMGMLPVDVDRDEVDRMFRQMREGLKQEGVSGEASNLVTCVQEGLRGNRVTASMDLVMLFRTVSTLEAVCKRLDESFDFTRQAYLYVLRSRSRSVASAFERVPDAVVDILDAETVAAWKQRADSVADAVEDVTSELARSGDRLA